MSEFIPRRKCAPEILKILKDHSPVTMDMIQRMIEPKIPKKNLRQSLGILRRKGLVDMLIGDHETFFYQLHQSMPVRKQISERLDCNADEITLPILRRQDWFHNQWCEFWSRIITKAFPDVEIVREHTIGSNEIAKSVLLVDQRDTDMMPDFLALLPVSGSGERVSIAFEIERTRKSNERIMRKLKKYVVETKIDGLIYICDSGRLSETIRLLYQQQLLAKAPRVKHYADHFFLFSDTMSAGPRPLERFFNANAEQVSLLKWCNQLRSTKRTLRRDTQFK